MKRWYILIAILILALGVLFIATGETRGDRKLKNKINEKIERLYEDNAYIVVKNVTYEKYLLLNKNKESVVETDDSLAVYLNNGTVYVFNLNDRDNVYTTDGQDEVASLSYCLNHKGSKITEIEAGYEVIAPRSVLKDCSGFLSLLTDPTITSVVFKIEEDESGVLICRCFKEDTDDTRTLLWEINGYQELFEWELDDGWYDSPSKTEVYELYDALIAMVNQNVLSIYDTVGDKEESWNVTGDEYLASTDSVKSLDVDSALLYMQNYNLGFVGNKTDLLALLEEFYESEENRMYNLYTAVQYICALEDWLISGVDYSKNEELVIAEETTNE